MRVLSVGECMVELSGAGPGLWRQGFAGDTFNTAWYLRASLSAQWQVDYLTMLGQDPMSDAMLAFMAENGIGTLPIRRDPVHGPGLYMIQLQNGERSFTYWRDSSAARGLADDPVHLARTFDGTRLIYFSGITLAILPPSRREALLSALAYSGALVAFDPNMRPRLWGDLREMRDWTLRAATVADIALPGFEEEAMHFGDRSTSDTAKRYLSAGVDEVIVKNGGGKMLAATLGGLWEDLTFPREGAPLDTTGAGDSFNGAYLAARLSEKSVAEAAALAHGLAQQVIMHPGALLPFDQIQRD